MPLKLVPPRPGRSPNWTIRGTYRGVSVDRSAGTPDKRKARAALKSLELEIERGELSTDLTFADAVIAYVKGGGEKRYLEPLLDHFGTTPIAKIGQAEIDACAAELYPPGISEKPSALNATINRHIHTPMSAALKAIGRDFRVRRPKQPVGRVNWLAPEEAKAWLEAAPDELRRLSVFLLYTGCRVTEACDLMGDHVSPAHRLAYLGRTKNNDGRAVYLPGPVMAVLEEMDLKRGERVFGYEHRHAVYKDWRPLRAELGLPDWWTPHAACHTWATWMRQHAGMDLAGLIGTGRWKDLKSVLRYTHVVVSEESKRAENLPELVENPWNPDAEKNKALK